jgi:hypothetical protein
MTRPGPLGAAALLVFVAGAHAPIGRNEPLPLPPTPPSGGPPAVTAPRPDPAAQSPHGVASSDGPIVTPAWFAAHPYSPSEGFIPGSHVTARPDGRTEIAPGVNMRVPLK